MTSIDTILDEMAAEIRALREDIMAQNILRDAYKNHIKSLEIENADLKRKLEGIMK